MKIAVAMLLLAACASLVAADVPIVLTECLGCAWQPEVVHRPVICAPKQLYPGLMALYAADGAAVPMQACNVTTHPDGSVHTADIWFRGGLPANATVTYTLKAVAKGFKQPASEVAVENKQSQ